MGENEEEKNVNAENEAKTQETNVESKQEATQNVAKEPKTQESNVTTEKKEEPNFKKVETKTKKSKHRVIKAILILILTLIIAYFVLVMRNYFILSKIVEKASAYKDVTNYTYHATAELGEYTIYRKDNIIRFDQKSLDVENTELIIWSDEDTKENITAFPNEKVAIRNGLSMVQATLPFEFANINDQMTGMILYTWIYTDEYDGKECYVLCFSSDFKKWVEKDTGLVVKIESSSVPTEITNIEVNNVDEVYKPDLTGYKITDNTQVDTTTE